MPESYSCSPPISANSSNGHRDWLAGLAMQGLLAYNGKAAIEDCAEISYKIADAMISQSKQ